MARGVCVYIALVFACTPASALAHQPVKLTANFDPDALGANTTITVGFRIPDTHGAPPPPLDYVALTLPSGIGIAAMTLGLSTCNAHTLYELGVAGCSPNSIMGKGVAEVEVPLGPSIVRESVFVTALMGPPTANATVILFDAVGVSPLAAEVMFPGTLESSAGNPLSLELNVQVPLVAGVPGGPDVSVTAFSSTIGPRGLRYVARAHGSHIEYVPVGLSVPTTCRRPGFVFQGIFGFADGSQTTATSVVPCPRVRRVLRKKGRDVKVEARRRGSSFGHHVSNLRRYRHDHTR
jgi:hypothetical protein